MRTCTHKRLLGHACFREMDASHTAYLIWSLLPECGHTHVPSACKSPSSPCVLPHPLLSLFSFRFHLGWGVQNFGQLSSTPPPKKVHPTSETERHQENRSGLKRWSTKAESGARFSPQRGYLKISPNHHLKSCMAGEDAIYVTSLSAFVPFQKQ